MATNYATNVYAKRLEDGQRYQDFIAGQLWPLGIPVVGMQSREAQLRFGENLLGLEIKFDDKFKETDNVYIETAEKSNPNNPRYVDSGIYREDNSWLYLIGDYSEAFIFAKATLVYVYETFLKQQVRQVETPTSRGFLLAREQAAHLAARCLGPWSGKRF